MVSFLPLSAARPAWASSPLLDAVSYTHLAEHLYQFGNIDFLCFPYQDGVIPHRLQLSFDFPLKGQYALIGDFTQGHGDFRLENTVDG